MTPGVRLLLSVLVTGGTFLLALVATGALGLNDAAHLQMPVAAFLATAALWPLLPKDGATATRHGFVDWLSYNAALMLVLGLVMYGVKTWNAAQTLLEDLPK